MSTTSRRAKAHALNREAIKNGAILDLVAEAEKLGLLRAWSHEERAASLAERPRGAPVWVFGYGSLMWNPAFEHVERRAGLIRGFHRRFCLWTPLGRGSPDNPGLVLGLESGGSCRGVAFRLDEAQIAEELDILWSREMVGGAYSARWVTVETDAGPVAAITFTINHGHERYAGRLHPDETARALATAAGALGSCAEYLENTVAHLDELGIGDGPMHDLLARVRANCAAT